MWKRVLTAVCALCLSMTGAAFAAPSCDEYQRALAKIEAADTKQDVVEQLVLVGVPKETAQNFANASPDVDVARAVALRNMTPARDTACKKQ